MENRIISMLLAVLMIIALMPVMVTADNAITLTLSGEYAEDSFPGTSLKVVSQAELEEGDRVVYYLNGNVVGKAFESGDFEYKSVSGKNILTAGIVSDTGEMRAMSEPIELNFLRYIELDGKRHAVDFDSGEFDPSDFYQFTTWNKGYIPEIINDEVKQSPVMKVSIVGKNHAGWEMRFPGSDIQGTYKNGWAVFEFDIKFSNFYGGTNRLFFIKTAGGGEVIGPTLTEGTGKLSVGDTLQKDTWYNMRSVINLDENTADFYLDGVMLQENRVLPDKFSDIKYYNLPRFMLAESDTGNSTYYIDNIRLSNYGLSSSEVPSSTDATFVIEAEDMTLSSDAKVVSDSDASGGKAVMISADDINSASDNLLNPTLSKDITLSTAGTYSLWARALAPDSKSNEIYYSYTGASQYQKHTFSANSSYTWSKIFDVRSVNGDFTIDFKYSEPGTTIDKLVFTADPSFVPVSISSQPYGEMINRIYPLPEITPISGHPRLFATQELVDELYANSQTPELIKMFKSVSALANEEPVSAVLKDAVTSGTNYTPNLTRKLQARAYMRLIGQADAAHSQRTVKYTKELLATVKWDPSYQDITRRMGDVILTSAIVYDWCYDEMTAADKEFFIAHFKKLAYTKEIGYPPVKKYAFAGHGAEREIMCDLLAAGVACYDEDTEIYDLAAGRFFEEYVPTRKIFNKTGSHPVGSAYGHFRYTWELCAASIFDRMGYKNIMGEEISSVTYRYLYQRLPYGLWIKDNDDFAYSTYKYFSYNSNDALCYLLASSLSGDEYLKAEWLKHFSLNNYTYDSQNFYLWSLLFSDPTVGRKTPEDLPLTYTMSYPLTAITARTSWQQGLDADTSVIHMKAEEKVTADTAFADLGNFLIYYKGNLLVNGGNYGNQGDWGTAHDMNYSKRTISKNCMTVYDPDEVFDEFHETHRNPPLANDGGQTVFAPRVEDYDDYLTVEDSAHTDGIYVGPDTSAPVFSYVKTDLTNAYSDKINQYSRSMVAINFFDREFPQGFVCFDNMQTRESELKKTWNLQSVGAPVIEGNKTVISRTDNGFNGKLVNTTLLPVSDNISLTRVGEADGTPVTYVDGKNYPNPDINGYSSEHGNWRVELSPKIASPDDLFLNAMYVTDADNSAELTPYYEDNDEFCGVTMKDAAVYFSKNYNYRQNSAFTLTVRDNGYEKVSVLVTDIAAGKWSVSGADSGYVTEVTQSCNALYALLEPGTYNFVPADVSAEVSVFENTSGKRATIGDFHIYNTGTKLFMYQESETKLIEGQPYVPMRSVFEKLGATVAWDGSSATVVSKKTAIITPGTRTCTINGTASTLGHLPLNIDGTLYVCPEDFKTVLGHSFTYDSVAGILKIG